MRRTAALAIPLVLVLISCRDVLAPAAVEGVYVLGRIGQVSMPGEITDATLGSYRVVFDTLELRRDGSARWARHHERRPDGAADWIVQQFERHWTFVIRGDEVRLRSVACPLGAAPCSTLPISQTKVRVAGSELHADGGAGVAVWTRVRATAP
jgi:hypothetical protein